MISIIKSIFRIISRVIFLALLAVVVVFCINNTETVVLSLKPLPFEVETSVCLVIILSLLFGMLLGMAFSSVVLVKEKFKNLINGWRIKFLQHKVNKHKAKASK